MDTFFFDLTLKQAAAFVAVLSVLGGAALLAVPAACRAYVPTIGRHKPTAWALTAIDLLWVAWIINQASLGRFEFLKPWLYLATPLSFYLIIHFVDELLGVRALAGLLLLMANPVLNAARWMDTEWRLVMTVLAYVWAIAGITLTLSPYLWRRWTAPLLATDRRARAAGAGMLLFAAGLFYLAARVY
ncbi:MAG: hypothetical protein NZ740_03135 [Kiritimatiellae bacterium]|nr:hypothetical protein [Kiritimatiellia bacterium]MDW8458086.1 hypothetical protein [Verrucomicrobiota bacterium]